MSHSLPSDCPITGVPADESATKESKLSRRSLIRFGAAAAAGLATAWPAQQAQAAPTAIKGQFQLLQKHENDHVKELLRVLGSNARPKPTFQNLLSPNLSAFVTLSQALENTGVGAYLGAVPAILDPTILSASASIALIEARHAGFLNVYRSAPMTENVFGAELSFERALTPTEVGQLAGPYIASLNGGPPVSYSPTRSATNDIAILNYALALEYLEAEYYNLNVPRFFA